MELDSTVRSYRHALHRIPELALEERETACYIRKVLRDAGIPFREVGTGTIADFPSQSSTRPITALRAEIDGLRIEEHTGLPFSSVHAGNMHACGHDANTAMLLAAAIIINRNKPQLHAPVRLIFQPAEEAKGGARNMIADGALEEVGSIFCIHMRSDLPVGVFATKKGTIHASSDGFDIHVKGKTAHGASPEMGVDAIVTASEIISSLQKLVSRETSAFQPAVLTIGTIQGGKARNIIADSVRMEGTLRAQDGKLRETLVTRIVEVVRHVAEASRAEGDVAFVQSYPLCVNEAKATERASALVSLLFGKDALMTLEKASMGGEDFGFYEAVTSGCKLYLGTGKQAAIHTPEFDIDEDTLHYGVALLCALALLD